MGIQETYLKECGLVQCMMENKCEMWKELERGRSGVVYYQCENQEKKEKKGVHS